jgi:hypothetical protein
MADCSNEAENIVAIIFKVTTFVLLSVIMMVAFWASNWRISAELDVVVLAHAESFYLIQF